MPTAHLEPIDDPIKEINLKQKETGKTGTQNYIVEVNQLSRPTLLAIPGLEVASPWPGEPNDRSDSHLLITDISNPELQRLAQRTKGQSDQFRKIIGWCNANQIATIAAHPTHRNPSTPKYKPKELLEAILNPKVDYKDGDVVLGIRIPNVRIREAIFSYPYDFDKGVPRLFELFNHGLDKEQEAVDLLLELLMKGHRIGVTSGNDFHTRLAHQEFDPIDPEKSALYRKRYAEGLISSNWDRVTGVYPERPGAAKPSTKEAVLKALWDGRCDARCRYSMRVTKCEPFPSIEPVEVTTPGIDVELTSLGTKYKAEAQIWLIGPGVTDQASDVITLGGVKVAGDSARITWRDPNGRLRKPGQEVTIVLHLPERYLAVWHQRVARAAEGTPAATPDPRLAGWRIVVASESKQGEPAGTIFTNGEAIDSQQYGRYNVYVYGPRAVAYELFVTLVTDGIERITKRQRHFPPAKGQRAWLSATAINDPWVDSSPRRPMTVSVKERRYQVRLLEAEKDERGQPTYGPTVATFTLRKR